MLETNQSPKIKLWGDRVLIKVSAVEETVTPSGIFIPKAKEGTDGLTFKAEVIKIAPRFKKELEAAGEEALEIGDLILLSQFAGSDVKINGTDYKVLKGTDIMGVLDKD